MVVALKPGRFYGSSLPRPRILLNVPDDKRSEPPGPVNASLLRWAADASWKMGGISSTTKRFQGKIEGRLSKLRAMEEESEPQEQVPAKAARSGSSSSLKWKGRFGGTSSKRSSRWKPHRKRMSRKKSPLRLTIGKDIMRKHEEQIARSSGKPASSDSPVAQASPKRPSKTRARASAAPKGSAAKRPRKTSVKRELLVEEDSEEEDEDESDDSESELDESVQVELKSGQVSLRRSCRLRSSPSGAGVQASHVASDSESQSESEFESESEDDA